MNSAENDPGAPGIAESRGTDPNLKMQRLLMPIDFTVPIGFTPASLHALRSSARMSEKMGGAVCLPHVVNCRATIETAASENSDLIIMAIHDHKGMQRVFRRDTCRLVETEASGHVLTLHRDDADEVEPKSCRGTARRGSANGWGRCF